MHHFVQYAIRLGYTASDAEMALSTLGHDAITNDLLTVVISLKAATSARQNDLLGKRKTLPKSKRRCLSYKLQGLSYVSAPDTGSWSPECISETALNLITISCMVLLPSMLLLNLTLCHIHITHGITAMTPEPTKNSEAVQANRQSVRCAWCWIERCLHDLSLITTP